jgi:hypothetical protein
MRLAGLVALMLGLSACATSSGGVRPAWVDKGPNLDHPDFIYVVGRCSGKPSADEARRCALTDANEQLRNVIGAQGGLVQDEFTTSRLGMVDQGGGRHVLASINDYWILVGYPRKRMISAPPPR